MRAAFLLLMLLPACEIESEAEALAWDAPEADDALTMRQLARSGGCGDATLFGSNAADTQAIFFNFQGLASQAQAAGGPISLVLNLPHPMVGGSYQTGRRLTSATCVGAFPLPGPRVVNDWTLSGGTLYVDARPLPGGGPGMPLAEVELSLVNPAFTAAGMGFGFMGSIEIPPTTVGFYPP